ncbi:MAG: diguanylate cyclase domain-containing protein [Chitinophagales bacterium]
MEGQQDNLFVAEKKALEEARARLAREADKENPLYSGFQELIGHYERLLRQSSKLLRISDSQYRLLHKARNDVRNLLDNAGQGFLTFGKDLVIGREYSAECERIFGDRISKRDILDLLVASGDKQRRRSLARDLEMVFLAETQEEKQKRLMYLPSTMELDGRYIRLEYRSIEQNVGEGIWDVIMLVLTDVTEKRQTEERIRYLSYHDSLTGLYNRTYIDSQMPYLDQENQMPLSIIMGDVNGLKLTNDVFGHQEGDCLLQNFAKVISGSVRETDLIVRWGGDEFLVVLPRADQRAAEAVCKRIYKACLEFPADAIPLSIALGTATRLSSEESIQAVFKRAEDKMYSKKLIEKQASRRYIVGGLERALADRGDENQDHIDRLRSMVLKLADRLEVSEEERQELEMLASFHDIGKVGISASILNKPGSLSPEEIEIVHRHSEIGYRMAQSIGEFRLANAILAHHEHWNGAGYPRGLKGEHIPFSARVLTVADAFDAMTHIRPYRSCPLSPSAALRELQRYKGTQFEPRIVDIFIEINQSDSVER